jgi:hypothetical protein
MKTSFGPKLILSNNDPFLSLNSIRLPAAFLTQGTPKRIISLLSLIAVKKTTHAAVYFFAFYHMCCSPLMSRAQMNFIHPGGTHNQSDLAFVKSKIEAGEQPWTRNFDRILMLAKSKPIKGIPTDENGQKEHGQIAYANALAWWYTGNDSYAENTIDILNRWGKDFKGYSPVAGQNLLLGGWIGSLLGPAAELLRGYKGWKPSDLAMVQTMFKQHFYPVLNTMSTWNGNVDLTQIDAMMHIAVFCEDENEFKLGISRLRSRTRNYIHLASDTTKPDSEAWFRPKRWADGLTQETCRDNGHHSQFAMASAIHAMEVAWNQGVDLYGENAQRYMAALELLALQLNTGDMQGVCSNTKATDDMYATWEVGFNHYHNRKGNQLPNTRRLLEKKIRHLGQSEWNIFHETLTHNLEGLVGKQE